MRFVIEIWSLKTLQEVVWATFQTNWTCVKASGCWIHICEFYSSQNVKIINVWDRVIGYMTFRYDCANATCIAWTSWASLQQADAQTAVNETESKSQTLNTQSSSLKVAYKTNLSFQCWCRALSYCGLWSWNELIINKMQLFWFRWRELR